MARKHPYRLLCPIARALDVVGDRWSLLILRDLHAGPARFQELQEGLGVATNLLATRLTELSAAGTIEKVEVDGRSAYALTELGRRTDMVIWELARFGTELEPDPDPRPPGNLRTVALPLRIALSAVEDRPTLSFRLLIDDEVFTVVSTPESVQVDYRDASTPVDLVLRTSYVEFLAVNEGRITLDEFAVQHLEVVEGPEHMGTFAALIGAAMTVDV